MKEIDAYLKSLEKAIKHFSKKNKSSIVAGLFIARRKYLAYLKISEA
jgi:hypothetical protein